MNGLVIGYLLIERIGVLHGAVFHAGSTARTFIFNDIPGLLDQGYLEITRFTRHAANFGIRQDFDIWMPADLDQFGRKYSH